MKRYEELNALKGKLREEGISYRALSADVKISLNALNAKLNGDSVFNTDEVERVAKRANISPEDFIRYFFPRLLRNAINE